MASVISRWLGCFLQLSIAFFWYNAAPDKARGSKFLIVVYAPALLSLILFVLLGDLSKQVFVLEQTALGWRNVQINHPINYYYEFYSVLFMIVSMALGFKWYQRIVSAREKQQIKWILISFIAVFMISFFIDDVSSFVYRRPLARSTIILLLLPFSLIYYDVRKYDLFVIKSNATSDKIIDDNIINKIFMIIGQIYIIAAFVLFAVFAHSAHYNLLDELIFNGILLIIGVSHFIVPYFLKSRHNEYMFLSVMGSMMILLIFVHYRDNSGITIWAMFFYLIVISAVFDRNIYAVFMASIMIAAQVLFWFVSPSHTVIIDGGDYFGRILIILLTALITIFVNNLYRKKIAENNKQIKTQALLTTLSRTLIDINEKNKHIKLNALLAACNKQFGYVRAYICEIEKDLAHLNVLHYHENGELSDTLKTEIMADKLPFKYFSWAMDNIMSGERIIVKDTDALTDHATQLKRYLNSKKSMACAAFPIFNDDALIGMLIFELDHVIESEAEFDYLKIVSHMIGDAKKKLNYQDELYNFAHYDDVTGLRNRSLFSIDLDRMIAASPHNSHAVLFVDIDNFKHINDAFGHKLGDEVIKNFAEMLNSCTYDDCLVARFGGDEFILAMGDVKNQQQVEGIA